MNPRLDLAGASVLPFEFPALGAGETAIPPAVEPDVVTLDSLGDPTPPAVPEPNGTPLQDDPAGKVAALAAEFEQAHAEGLRLGFEEGRKNGYAEGYADGVKAGGENLAEAARRLAAIAATLGGPLATLERPVEEAVVALALEVARCVIGGEVKRSREFLVRLVRQAIAKVPLEMGTPRVLLNPDDLDLVQQLVSETDLGNALLVADETVEAGGCLVVADGDDKPVMDRRWNVRAVNGVSQVNLTLSSRWREVMLTLFDGDGE